MTSESAPKSTRTIEIVKLDKSSPYVRATSTFPLKAAKEDFGPVRQKLAQSLNKAWRAYQGSSDNGREGVCIALAAACDFIEAVDPQAGEMFDRFNTVLVAALNDLDKDVTAPLLKKATGYDREKDSFAHRDLQSRAAAAVAGLMDARYLRDDAAKKVMATLTKNGFPTTQRTVEKWYDERLPAGVKKRKGRPPKSAPGTQSEDARLHYVVNQARGTAKFLLDELTFFTRLWFPSPQKGSA
jgi:hypothetical protein